MNRLGIESSTYEKGLSVERAYAGNALGSETIKAIAIAGSIALVSLGVYSGVFAKAWAGFSSTDAKSSPSLAKSSLSVVQISSSFLLIEGSQPPASQATRVKIIRPIPMFPNGVAKTSKEPMQPNRKAAVFLALGEGFLKSKKLHLDK